MSDIVDQANDLLEYFMEKALKAARQNPIGSVPLTLRVQVDGTTVRICDHCEQDIPENRINAVPDAVLCVECQKQMERIYDNY